MSAQCRGLGARRWPGCRPWLRDGEGGAGRAAATASSGERAHGQDGVAVEGVPQPDLVLIESGLPFCLLVAFFHRPSLPGHGDQSRAGRPGAGRGVAVEERQVSKGRERLRRISTQCRGEQVAAQAQA